MPTKLTINKQYTIYDMNDWPHIAFNNNITLPILSLVHRGIRKVVFPIKQIIINNQQMSSDCPNTQLADTLQPVGLVSVGDYSAGFQKRILKGWTIVENVIFKLNKILIMTAMKVCFTDS